MRIIQIVAGKLLAKQLGRPSGVFGRYVMGRLLNRTTSTQNLPVLEELALGRSDKVLEVGFGGGALLETILQHTPEGFAAGVELSEEMVAAVSLRLHKLIAVGRLELRRGTIEALPYPDAHFDKACSVNTVYFWRDLDLSFKEFYRVLRPGGHLVLGLISADDLRRVGLDQQGFAVYSPDEIAATLARNGFRPRPLRLGSDSRGTFFTLAAELSAMP